MQAAENNQGPFAREWKVGTHGQSFQTKVRPETTSTGGLRQLSRPNLALPTAAAQRNQKSQDQVRNGLDTSLGAC